MITDYFGNIGDIVILVIYVVGLSEFYHQNICKSKSQSSPKIWLKWGFVRLSQSVSHPKSDPDQNLILLVFIVS